MDSSKWTEYWYLIELNGLYRLGLYSNRTLLINHFFTQLWSFQSLRILAIFSQFIGKRPTCEWINWNALESIITTGMSTPQYCYFVHLHQVHPVCRLTAHFKSASLCCLFRHLLCNFIFPSAVIIPAFDLFKDTSFIIIKCVQLWDRQLKADLEYSSATHISSDSWAEAKLALWEMRMLRWRKIFASYGIVEVRQYACFTLRSF